MTEYFKELLSDGVVDHKLSNKIYNTSIPSYILLALIVFTSFLSVVNFSLDMSGLFLLLGSSVLVLVAVTLSFVLPGGLLGLVTMIIGAGFYLFGENESGSSVYRDITEKSLVSVDYVIDKSYIITIETIALLSLFLFLYQSISIVKEQDIDNRQPIYFVLYIVFGALLVKSLYGIFGGEYESFALVIMLLVFSFLAQKTFIKYANVPIVTEDTQNSFNSEAMMLASLPVLFYAFDFAWPVWLLLPVFYLYMFFFIQYKTIAFNLTALGSAASALIYIIYLILSYSINEMLTAFGNNPVVYGTIVGFLPGAVTLLLIMETFSFSTYLKFLIPSIAVSIFLWFVVAVVLY